MQKLGYPNISIKLFEDYDAWLANRFIELASTFTTLTMRDGLTGKNEGRLQFYDSKNMHTRLDGDQIIQISVSNSNSETVLTRLYATKNMTVSVDQKGDNMITVQLMPFYKNKNLKFSRVFFSNATESIQEMIRILYINEPMLAPKITGENIHIPLVPWVFGINEYMEYVRDNGLSIKNDSFTFIWEDFFGIHIEDFIDMINQEPRIMLVGEPTTIGQFSQQLENTMVFDFQWLAKNNSYNRNPYEDATIYSYSMLDKNCTRIVNGSGNNSIMISRTGGYADQLYRNGYEEATRVNTMSQYDSYAVCKTYGDFTITPSNKLIFVDEKNQFLTPFYVDEVIHEITNETSMTTIYMFSHAKKINEIEYPKVKNELKFNTTTEESDSK